MTGKEDLIEIIPEELKKEREELRNYFIKATNIEDSPEEIKVLDDMIIRLQQLGFTLKNKNKLAKYKKAFEILNEKLYIQIMKDIEEYYLIGNFYYDKINKEEYELLEELMRD